MPVWYVKLWTGVLKFWGRVGRSGKISLDPDGPLYENTVGYNEPLPPVLLSYSPTDDVDEHIYDIVENSFLESRPANIFLSLVDDEGSTISPDPNIYEVPPGAIFNSNSCFEDFSPLGHISPPSAFQDKLTWERFHFIADGDHKNDAIYSLPIKFGLNGSAIVRPKKKKHRPGIEALLNQITSMKEAAMENERKDGEREGDDEPAQQETTKDIKFKNEIVSVADDPNKCAIMVNSYSSSNEVIVDNITQVVPNNLTVLTSVDSLPVEVAVSTGVEGAETPSPKEFTSIIEISGDGTWNTTKIPASHLETSKNCESNEGTDNNEEDFLSTHADVRAKHVNLAYSGQYYTSNCPVASIKPMKHEEESVLDTKKNIGAQIMEKYEEERRKIIEIKNLPEVSLLDVDESLEEIQIQRRKIIESQAVRAKRIDSWIKGRATSLDEAGIPMLAKQEPEEDLSSEEAIACDESPKIDSANLYLDENGEVVYDSIIQNKNKIKSYWEQLMLAAELANQRTPAKSFSHHQHSPASHAPPAPPVNFPAPPTVPHHVVAEKIHSPDLSEAEFYDALSHVSTVQTPDLLENSVESLKLSETVVERDIRIQQERERALVIERQKALKSAEDKVGKSPSSKEKEEELQPQMGTPQHPDEAYLSIPTTDEGNFSEYGSEDKEDHSPDGSRVMSPVGTTGITSHHRTQSLDSMSSGHSSGSGTASHPDLSMTKTKTFGPVKPLDEPEDIDILSYVKDNAPSLLKDQTIILNTTNVDVNGSLSGYEKETPIEKEIRLSREREEELRREKLILPPPPTLQKVDTEKKKETLPRMVSTRVSPATQRVQQEIELANQREKEMKQWGSDDLQKDVSPKIVIKPIERKPKPIPTVHIDTVKGFVEPPKTPNNNVMKNAGASPKLYIQNPQQKGLMKRFLASRGKMGSTPGLNSLTSPTSVTMPSLKTPSLSPSSLLSEPFFSFTSLVHTKEGEEPLNLGTRPGYKSAEDKIQSELREMKRREEELRQQRRSNLYSALSQPDLLNMTNDMMMEREMDHEEDELTRLPNTSKLRSALSVQNLLDVDDKPVPRRMPKKRSALIEQWESRIQSNN